MRKGTAKDALARLRWSRPKPDWSQVEVTIRHHGAPRDEKTIIGSAITALGSSFFEVDAETSIPYHRVKRITVGGQIVYERSSSSANRS